MSPVPTPSSPPDAPPWWQTGIIYQIYPRSFQDGNGDGVGDLRGILARLDYLAELGVRGLWLSPICPSPMHDFGYDVADYTAIHPLFGTLADFDALLAAVHARGMKLILDLVPNHTSNEHPWFIESRASRENPKRDWYLWRDPAPGGGPPNNWLSFFGGPAWTFDPTTGQYYLHQFAREQPELNYRNPAVPAAMLDCMRFWLDRGVDGFRVDVIWLLIKDERLRDEPPNPDWDGRNPHARLQHIHTADQPEVHGLIRAMRKLLDGYPDRVMLGEIDLPPAELMPYYGAACDECQMPVNFRLVHTPWQAPEVRRAVNEYERLLPPGCWPNWVLGNHDRRRLASRIGQAQARVANLLLLTLRGTPTCYYGDEIGLENGMIPSHLVQDPQAVNQPEIAAAVGRDPQRTPMQWDASPNAGFAPPGVEPWLPVSADYRTRNVAAQRRDGCSPLNFFCALVRLRQSTQALVLGDYAEIPTGAEEVFAYRRSLAGESYLVVLNFGSGDYRLDLGGYGQRAEVVLSTGMTREGMEPLARFELRADEGVILRL
jgi:alpha-glucosidase